MLSKTPLDAMIPFADPESMFSGFSKSDIINLAYLSGDFMLAIDEANEIRDVATHAANTGFTLHWIGQKWVDIVTVESRPKILELLDSENPGYEIWRQVNHINGEDDLPVNYKMIKPENSPWRIAIGRDLRTISALQQRLLKTQQSMERDYLHLRQTETRYRLLFDTIGYPVLIVDAQRHSIQQANRACYDVLAAPAATLEGKSILSIVDPEYRNELLAYIGAASVNNATPPMPLRLFGRKDHVTIIASAFRQSGKQYWLVHIDDGQHAVPSKQSDQYILDVVEKMPDAFVLADEKQMILVANRAFADLVQVGAVEQLLGAPLSRFIGRPDVDLSLLKKQLKDHQNVRNFSSIVNDVNGGEEPVEISAILVEREQPLFGYSVRSIARRERDLQASNQELPRSIDQLTDLVGRKKLKDIVRESTDLIERMCIEAALVHTADNRASAAEILGLSRQSLYSKLHRHGLGNLTEKD